VVDHTIYKVLSPLETQNRRSSTSIYIKWTLNLENHSFALVVRTELDAFTVRNGKTNSVCIRKLNHVPLNAGDYWAKVDSRLGAVLANEVRKNSYIVGRWTVEALLSDADWLHLGFCWSRRTKKY
jgi:Eukaryotic translation initiation factor 3 subunit 7 (eIF-3)